MTTPALKEWATTIEALLDGSQVVVLRKGGIGEKRFEIPHQRFFLFPSHLHQRPALLTPAARERYSRLIGVAEEPTAVELRAWAEVEAAHAIHQPDALTALEGLHILSADYASERLRWRRTQPLWAVVLRVHALAEPPTVAVLPEYGGCVSWIELADAYLGERAPVLDDAEFSRAAAAVEDALSPFALAR